MKYNLNYWACKWAISFLLFVLTGLCLLLPLKSLAQNSQTVVNNNFTTPINVPANGCVFKWVNKNTSIGLGATGTGDIPAFKAINNTYKTIVDTITITSVPEREFAYVGNSKTQTLSVVNLVDNSVVTTLPINSEVWGTAVTADDSKVYITSESHNFITVFDAINNRVDHTIPIPKPDPAPATPAAAWGLALSKDGKFLYATNTTGGGIYMVNLQTVPEQVTILFPQLYPKYNVGSTGDMYTLLSSDDGTKLYSNLGVYDIPTNTIVDTTGLMGSYDMVFSPDHSKIYITNRPDVVQAGSDNVNSIRVYDVASRTVSYFKIHAMAGLSNLAISPDGNTLYADNFFYDAVSVIDLQSKTVKGTISIGNNHKGLSVGLGGSRLYVISGNGGMSVIDTKTLKVVDTVAVGGVSPIGFGKFTTTGSCYNEPTTYILTVEPTPPQITASGTLPVMQTTYGTPSASGSFTVSALGAPAGILVSPPAGFEVSIDDKTFADTLTIKPNGSTVSPTQVYVRLKANSPAKIYTGDIILGSPGVNAGSIKVSTATSEIKPAPLIISATNVNKTYGSTLIAGIDSAHFTAAGLQNADAINSVTFTYGAGSAATDIVNTYTGSVNVSSSTGTKFISSNYTITYNGANLIVVPAPLTLTADNKSRVYADPNPVFTYTYKGLVNNEAISVLTTLPTLSNAATAKSPLGQYPIDIAGAAAANYQIIYVQGTLTVTELKLDIANAFTPNGDGINDTWEIKALGEFPNCVVRIMNRYGQQVFYSVGYGKAWDGKIKETVLPAGTYYYVISLTPQRKPVSGFLTLIN